MRISAVLLGAALMGCTSLATVKVDVVSERTALENQVLGTYNALDREMLLVASVRGVDATGKMNRPLKQSREHQDVIAAMQILDFHADDLQVFKRLGWIGENNQGRLERFPMKTDSVAQELLPFVQRFTEEEFAGIIDQVNIAREVIMERVIETNETLTDEDLPKVKGIFAKLNAENAKPGDKIQLADGTWRLKDR